MSKKLLIAAVVSLLLGGLVIGFGLGYLPAGDDEGDPGPEAESQEDRERYANLYQPHEEPEWIPEDEVSLEDNAMYEVTRYPDEEPTEEHIDEAWEVYKESYEGAEERGFFDFENAVDADYVEVDDIHYVNEEYYLNDENLNPYQPESLVYYDVPGSSDEDDKVLAGIMYHTHELEAEGEQFGGPLTVWHYHTYPGDDMYCHESVLNTGTELDGYECAEDDTMKPRGGEMIHVWFVEHPKGPFSSDMGDLIDPEEVAEEYADGKPPKMSEEEFKEYVLETHDR